MVVYIPVIAVLVIIIVYLIADIMTLKNKLKDLQYLFDKAEKSRDFWRSMAENFRQSLSSANNMKILSEADLKSLIGMVHPDRHSESRKQRASELFIKLKEIQRSNP